jgi:glutathione S-transferase
MTQTILYSYRRCPYAMRARMALTYSGIPVEIREISLRDKPPSMLAISPKGTVPVLQRGQLVIDESYQIMQWALAQSDSDQWFKKELEQSIHQWVATNDGPFKKLLDQYKYPDRFPQENIENTLKSALELQLQPLEHQLSQSPFIFGEKMSLADVAIFPFVRQFAMVDQARFDQLGLIALKRWLNGYLESRLYLSVMTKYPVWKDASTEKE